MTLAQHVRTLGRGPGRSRSLHLAEAEDAMTQMLSGDAAPEATGALLMLLRMKGETDEEIAGFTKAAQAQLPHLPRAALDWPSYAAGRTRGLPWFLLSARLVANAGYPVLLHGWNGPNGNVRAGLAAAGIDQVDTGDAAAKALETTRIAYLPLERFAPSLFALLDLRGTFGLRSCVNTVCRMLNPSDAPASVQGVFHPPYRLLQADAARLLGWNALTVIKGGGGEFERNPGKSITGFGLRDGQDWQGVTPPLISITSRMSDGPAPDATLAALWDGTVADEYAQAVVIGTAALALETLGVARAYDMALELWNDRLTGLAG